MGDREGMNDREGANCMKSIDDGEGIDSMEDRKRMDGVEANTYREHRYFNKHRECLPLRRFVRLTYFPSQRHGMLMCLEFCYHSLCWLPSCRSTLSSHGVVENSLINGILDLWLWQWSRVLVHNDLLYSTIGLKICTIYSPVSYTHISTYIHREL